MNVPETTTWPTCDDCGAYMDEPRVGYLECISCTEHLDCSVCWLSREWNFASQEYADAFPTPLEDGMRKMWGEHIFVLTDAVLCESHEFHGLNPAALEAAADTAEFIASWRGTNAGPTRPRVVAAMREVEPRAKRKECNQCSICHLAGHCPACDDHWRDLHDDPFDDPHAATLLRVVAPETTDGRTWFLPGIDS